MKNLKMKVIIISGPTGSGKTSISKQIVKFFKNGFVLSTDNYYKTGILSKILSRFVENYFDKKISFNQKLFKKDFNYIVRNCESKHKYSYDFKNKSINKIRNSKSNIEFIIVEGIFAIDLFANSKKDNYFFIELKSNKYSCMNRVIIRDIIERGKTKKVAKKDFLKSWDFYLNKNNRLKINNKKIIYSNTIDLYLLIKKILN